MSPPEEGPPPRTVNTRNAGPSISSGQSEKPNPTGVPANRTLGGNMKMRFTPKPIPRRNVDG